MLCFLFYMSYCGLVLGDIISSVDVWLVWWIVSVVFAGGVVAGAGLCVSTIWLRLMLVVWFDVLCSLWLLVLSVIGLLYGSSVTGRLLSRFVVAARSCMGNGVLLSVSRLFW